MYDGSKIIPGLIVFLGLVTFPFWFNVGQAEYKQPELKKVPKSVATECVEGTEWMRDQHMQLLNTWRDEALRLGKRMYTSETTHKTYLISLQNGCMKCHDDKENFCDKCHNTAAVSPYCWDCHLPPKKEN